MKWTPLSARVVTRRALVRTPEASAYVLFVVSILAVLTQSPLTMSMAMASELPLCLHIGQFESTPVSTDQKLEQMLAHARKVLGALSIVPIVKSTDTFPEHEVRTVSERDALKDRYQRDCVNVFILMRVFNADKNDEPISGVHWRFRGDTSITYIILSANASPDVLAHELGHLFGLGHTGDRNNIMCGGNGFREYGTGYSEDQRKVIRRWAQENLDGFR